VQQAASSNNGLRRQRNGNRWRTDRQRVQDGVFRLRHTGTDAIETARKRLSGSLSRNVARCCFSQLETQLPDTFAPKSHRAPSRRTKHALTHTCDALAMPPAGLAYTFLTPSLPAHPSARDTPAKELCFAYETRRHHPASALRVRLV